MSKRGVPIGYIENWAYDGIQKINKIGKGVYETVYRAIKRRRARSYGNFGLGSSGAWKIKGHWYEKKYKDRNGNTYWKFIFKGIKRPLRFNVK